MKFGNLFMRQNNKQRSCCKSKLSLQIFCIHCHDDAITLLQYCVVLMSNILLYYFDHGEKKSIAAS